MKHIAALITSNEAQDKPSAVYFEGGLRWAMLFTDALIKQLRGREDQAHLCVTGWSGVQTSGLFLHDEARRKAVRVGSNVSTGCGRIFWGASSDFDFPSRNPNGNWEERVMYFNEEDLFDAVNFACEFFTKP